MGNLMIMKLTLALKVRAPRERPRRWIMVGRPRVWVAVALAALAGAGLEAGGVCSSSAKVAPAEPAARPQVEQAVPTEAALASFDVSEVRPVLAVTRDRAGWDSWEAAHGFTVGNASKAPWHIVPEAANPPLRIQAEDGPGLDGGLIVPPSKAVRFAFQSEPGTHERRAVFSVLDQDGRLGARIVLTAQPPSPAQPQGTQGLMLLDLVGRDYPDSDIMTCHGAKAMVGIRAERYL